MSATYFSVDPKLYVLLSFCILRIRYRAAVHCNNTYVWENSGKTSVKYNWIEFIVSEIWFENQFAIVPN